jgi:hypothetical protein
MIAYSPLIGPPTNVMQLTSPGLLGPIAPGLKLIASSAACQLAWGSQTTAPTNVPFYFNSRPQIFEVGSAAPYLQGTGAATVSLYDAELIWNSEPPQAPRHVLTLADTGAYYQLDIHTATEIQFEVDTDTTITFADTFAKLLTANYFPIKSKVTYRWRLDNTHRFVHFDLATAVIASDKAFTATALTRVFTPFRQSYAKSQKPSAGTKVRRVVQRRKDLKT